jgi:hypothetical protein
MKNKENKFGKEEMRYTTGSEEIIMGAGGGHTRSSEAVTLVDGVRAVVFKCTTKSDEDALFDNRTLKFIGNGDQVMGDVVDFSDNNFTNDDDLYAD